MDREKLGHYNIESELGRGGMGVVYKGFDPTLNRHVAIKVLAEALAHDKSVVERFVREAKSMAALNDPHIIQIFFIGEDEGTPYFAMEYVTGESLSQRLKREGKLSVEDARKILSETAAGLSTAHAHGVIHRDIKPGNLMINDRGRIKIADFGIAKVQDNSERLTNTGEFVGTPGYLSPEVCIGQQVDQRSDIFALGIVFFEMLTGQIPFTEVSPLGMMLEVVKADIPDVRTINADVDERTCKILKRMIAKDPEQRYQTCDELLVDLGGTAPISGATPPPADQQPSSYEAAATSALNLIESSPDEAPPPQPETMISTPGQVLDSKREASGSSGVLPMAIAAVLVLSLAAGSMYLFRDQIFGDDTGLDTPSINLAQELDPNESNQAGDAEPVAVPTARTADLDDGHNAGGVELQTEQDSPGNRKQLVNTSAQELPDSRTDVQTAGDQRPMEPLQLAKVATPVPAPIKVPPPPPPEPRVVVVVIGDRAIAGPVEQILEDALIADGHVLMDEGFFDGIGLVASDQGVDLPGLSRLIQDNGATVLVLAQIDFLGETGLEYYGQYSTLYSVNLKVRNILLSERRSIGRGWQQKIDFTSLNASEKAAEAVNPFIDQLTDSLKEYRS